MATNKQCFCCKDYQFSPLGRIKYNNCGDRYDVCENCKRFHGTCPQHPNNSEASYKLYHHWSCDCCKRIFQDKHHVKLVTYCICGESFHLCLNCHAAQRRCPNHPVTECDGDDSSNDIKLVNLFQCYEDHYLCATCRNKDFCPIHPMSPRK